MDDDSLKCCNCKKLVDKASELLLLNGEGKESGRCQECSSISSSRQFRRLSTRSWALQGDGNPPRTRDAAFIEAREKIMAECPGLPWGKLREMTLQHLDMVKTYKTSDAGCFAEIAKSVSVSIMCRHTKCLFYGKKDQWIKHVSSEHYRCPQCGHVQTFD